MKLAIPSTFHPLKIHYFNIYSKHQRLIIECLLSNHLPILTTIQDTISPAQNTSWTESTCVESAFTAFLGSSLQHAVSRLHAASTHQDIDDVVHILTKILQEACNISMKREDNRPLKPWWNKDLANLSNVVFSLRRLDRPWLHSGRPCNELSTVMCDAESLMNTRPLTYLTEESEDLAPLTPSLFLHEVREVGVPDLDLIDNQTLSRKYQYIKRVREDLRERFRIEYFGFLRQETRRLKTTIPFKVGDMVLIGQESLKRLHWPLARIIQLYPGKDGLVRVAKVKTSSGDKIRPIPKLYNLEITPEIRCRDPLTERSPTQEVRLTTEEDPLTSQQEQHHIETPNVVSSYGRPIKRPNRSDLLNFSFPCLSRRDANSKVGEMLGKKPFEAANGRPAEAATGMQRDALILNLQPRRPRIEKYKLDNVTSYFADILVFSENEESHLKHLGQIFEISKKEGIQLRRDKCLLFMKRITYFGNEISENQISPSGVNVDVIKSLPPTS
ncbi:hypothetical protein LAZ67_10001589 [Cordylochernes scorpioides]|uniref:DUF5641 domain-containing protein n=1 Tax=Cordylochernes scorpioides TaxID=51811 RepID=A0ABY6KVZ1_9ARAC|nr:hypothetical protein LAZ67_10001589 [Cordylochernes scorpioides]